MCLLDAVNMAQGFVGLTAIAALMFGWLGARQLGQITAMAMFVAATAHTTDGVLGYRSKIIRLFGQRVTGNQAQIGAIVKISVGVVAFALSLTGIVLFGGRA